MKSQSTTTENQITYNTIIEVDDESKDFIPYWNLAMKEHLSNNFISVGPDSNKSKVKSLNSFYIKLVDKKEKYSPEKGDIIQSDILFTIDIYRIKKEKEFSKEYIKYYQTIHNPNNFNVFLYNIDEVKDNTLKNINKIYDKLRSKLGLTDFSFVPYNQTNYGKFYSVIDNFFINLKKRITIEYNKQMKLISDSLDKMNNMNDIYIKEEDNIYEYIKTKVLYLDLLTMGDFSEEIRKVSKNDMFKVFDKLSQKFIFENCASFTEINILEIKKKVKSKNLTNIEYQLFLLYNYIRSCRYLKEYSSLVNIMCNFAVKIDTYKSYFKSVYHFLYWKIYFIFNFINYLVSYQDVFNQKDFGCKNRVEQGILYLYSFIAKNLKNYGKKINIELPTIRIFMLLKNCLDNNMDMKGELEKIMNVDLGDIEKDENFQLFKNDIKAMNCNQKLKSNIYDIFTNKKAFIEEYLLILQIINKRNCEFINSKISIREAFDIIPILISLNKLEEAKKILNSLLEEKFIKSNKWAYCHQYICFIFIMLLNCLEKNKENLNIMFKLLDTNFTKINHFMKLLENEDKNLINDIISKYIESYSEIEKDNKDEKLDKIFSLDKAININLNLKNIKDNLIFINKSKTKKEKLDYKFTNKTGISVNIAKIQLIFEEFNLLNNVNNENDRKEKKQIIYEIEDDSNSFKSIKPFIKEQENSFDIIIDETKHIFKLNTLYKFQQIKFIIKNSLCGIYHIKDDLKMCINCIDMKITTQVYPSYDESDFTQKTKNKFFFNVLSKININLIDVPSPEELNNKSLKFIFEDINKKDDTSLIIQTLILKENLINAYPDIIIEDSSLEFPPGSIKEKGKLENIIIPFYVENTNFYSNGLISIKVTVHILDKNNNDKIDYSYVSYHNLNLIHLFNIKKKFRLMNDNYLMQSTFSLNVETNNVKIYTHNSENYSFYIDSRQALNLVLLLNNNKNAIIQALRQNFLEFSIDEVIKSQKENQEKKIIKYRLCYPEKCIIEEIKELTEIPYNIVIDVDDCQHKIFKEISVNINIKRKGKKNVVLLTLIHDNDNWAIIGKSKIIEEWTENDNKENEKNIKVLLMPLVDGFLKLPEIEFLEYEIGSKKDQKDDILNVIDSDNESKDIIIGKMNFIPIEYGATIEGNEKVLKITPITESSLKLNLT